jgi:hypothetical protein
LDLQTSPLEVPGEEDRVMQEKTRRRLGIGLFMLGFVIIWINGVAVAGHYLVGWSTLFSIVVIIGVAFLVVGMAIAARNHASSSKDDVL